MQLKLRLERGDLEVEDGGLSVEQIEREKWQTLGLQHLNDLQSKLMLVAGKASEGKEQVDLFVEVPCLLLFMFYRVTICLFITVFAKMQFFKISVIYKF